MSQRALACWLAAATVWGLGNAAAGQAAQVLLLGRDGHVSIQSQPLPAWAVTPAPRAHAARAVAHTAPVSVIAILGRLHQNRAITTTAYQRYVASMRAANSTLTQLSGTPAAELGAVIQNLRSMAGGGMLTPGRLPILFLTLNNNRQWWATGNVPSANQIVNLPDSEIDWEYYPGQGLELQELGSFFKADWLFTHGPCCHQYPRGTALLSQLIPLASRRAGGLTWEYYFNFDGGAPPWTSAMSQGTALEALTDAYKALGNNRYLAIAHQALPVLTTAPSRGVAVRTSRGIRFVQYSFDSVAGDEIINAFLQTLIGLDDYAQASGDPVASHLFAAGNAEAQHEVPSFDTGSWSLYQPGIDDTTSYHQLVTGFLQQLCSLTHAKVYCTTAAHFQAYSKHPPPGVG